MQASSFLRFAGPAIVTTRHTILFRINQNNVSLSIFVSLTGKQTKWYYFCYPCARIIKSPKYILQWIYLNQWTILITRKKLSPRTKMTRRLNMFGASSSDRDLQGTRLLYTQHVPILNPLYIPGWRWADNSPPQPKWRIIPAIRREPTVLP